MTLLRALLAGGLDHPDAVRVGEVSLSGPELLGAAAVVADGIAEGPAGAGPVAVDAVPTVETLVAVVGALLAGVPVVPVPPDVGPGERGHVLADSGAGLWLGERPPGVSLPCRRVDLTRRSGHVPARATGSLLLYTSGTTGAPKGVLLSSAAMAAGLDGLADAWDWTDADVLGHGLPLFHVHGLVLGVLGPLQIGSSLVHTGRPGPEAYAAAVAEHGASVLFGVPTVWSRVAADPASARALAPARLLVSGSAGLPVPVFERLRELTGQAPVERYGMSETMITLAVRADGERRAGWVGRPIAGVEARVCVTPDDGPDAGSPATAGGSGAPGTDGSAPAGELVPADGETIGELQVRGTCLFDGYLGRPEATAATWTADGWFATGDAAVVDADGYHRIVGRRSVDLIKTGGYRVGAGEVETALLAFDGISEAAVVGEPDDDLGQRIVAHVVCPDGPVDADAVMGFVGEQLSRHKRPREVRVVDELPRNAMGKVQKSRLRD